MHRTACPAPHTAAVHFPPCLALSSLPCPEASNSATTPWNGQDGLRTLDPSTRCFSDLPAWIDQNLGSFAHKTTLMYCTGRWSVGCTWRVGCGLHVAGELWAVDCGLRTAQAGGVWAALHVAGVEHGSRHLCTR